MSGISGRSSEQAVLHQNCCAEHIAGQVARIGPQTRNVLWLVATERDDLLIPGGFAWSGLLFLVATLLASAGVVVALW